MGDGEKASLRLQYNPKVRLAFHGATITTDAGLLAFREFDDALGLTEIAEDYLQESRTGRNILHHLVPLLRQSIYSRLAGYDDTNDAVRLSQDPAMRVIVGWQGSERKGASTSEMGRFGRARSGREPAPARWAGGDGVPDPRGQPAGAGTNEYPLGGTGDGPHHGRRSLPPASYPGYG